MGKKIAIFIAIVISIIALITYNFINYKSTILKADDVNKEFLKFNGIELSAQDVISLFNKACNYNNKNNVKKDNKGYYIENDENSLKINLKLRLSKDLYPMEMILKNGFDNFLKYYSEAKFRCSDVKLHEGTQLVSYMLIEEQSSFQN